MKQQIIALTSKLESIDQVITSAFRKIIKARARSVYYDYLQYEPLRWCLLNGDGNGKCDGSVIAECVDKPESEAEEELTPIEQLAKDVMEINVFVTTTDTEELYWYNGSGKYLPDQEWRIKKFCQEKQPSIKTHTVHEVINNVKRSTYMDRDQFDRDPYIRNMKNGLFDLNTRELSTSYSRISIYSAISS